MTKFIGNCNHIIDWNSVLQDVSNTTPAYSGPIHRIDDKVEGVCEIGVSWYIGGYTNAAEGGVAGWDMYHAGKQFDMMIVDQFAEYVKMDIVLETWISRILPGKMAPWHWDTNDKNVEYDSMNKLVRFSCHVSPPTPGHVFIIEDDCYYNQAQGNTYQWPSRRSWHAGANFGVTPKYLFNIFGIVK